MTDVSQQSFVKQILWKCADLKADIQAFIIADSLYHTESDPDLSRVQG
jgi:hypothetical protein